MCTTKHRAKEIILAQILEHVTSGAPHSKLRLDAALSGKQKNELINFLLREKMLEIIGNGPTYRITAKGSKFLRFRRKLDDLQEDVENFEVENDAMDEDGEDDNLLCGFLRNESIFLKLYPFESQTGIGKSK